MWIDGSQLLFLGISIVTFSAGLVVFAFSSEQVSVGAPLLLYLADLLLARLFILPMSLSLLLR